MLTRMPMPWMMVALAPVVLVLLAVISQIVFEHSESPLVEPATPSVCCWPAE